MANRGSRTRLTRVTGGHGGSGQEMLRTTGNILRGFDLDGQAALKILLVC